MVRDRFVSTLKRLSKIVLAIHPGTLHCCSSVGLAWNRRDHLDFVASGEKFDHNYFGREWFKNHSYAEDYKEFWSVYETALAMGYDIDVIDMEATHSRVLPRVLIIPVTSRWNSACEDFARLHLRRGGNLILVGSKANQLALKMPPSIGTPVQKWVRDIAPKELGRLGPILEDLGEKPTRCVKGKKLIQFMRRDEKGRFVLFLFSLADRLQQATVVEQALTEVATGAVFKKSQKISLGPKSGRVFWTSNP